MISPLLGLWVIYDYSLSVDILLYVQRTNDLKTLINYKINTLIMLLDDKIFRMDIIYIQ